MKRRGWLGVAVAMLLALMPATAVVGAASSTSARLIAHPPVVRTGALVSAAGVSPATTPKWLKRVNRYRALAGLPTLTQNAAWSHGNELHARYMVKNNVIGHDENPNKPYYTVAGRNAARNSDLTVSSTTATTNLEAVDSWMEGPFHAVGIIDPGLLETGFGSFRANDGGWEMGAGLDVLRGLGGIPSGVSYPIKYPSGSGELPLRSYSGYEYPDPLTSCHGYAAPSGPSIILQLGHGSVTPHVTAHRLAANGQTLASCVFDETNYTNTNDPGAEFLGRQVLDSRDAIVLMPKKPLHKGTTYHVSITANGHTYTWSFTVG